MVISIVDAIIVLLVLMGGIVGYKHGAIREGTQFIGLFLIVIISFVLKDELMVLMYENLPFFNFIGFIRGVDAVNILFYQLVAFLVIFLALYFVLRVIIVITGFVEWLLKLTVFLAIPSKFIGIFVGMLEYYVYVFIILYVLNMPFLNLNYVRDSKFGMNILDNTPILSGLIDDTVLVYTDVWNIVKDSEGKSSSEVNTLVLATLLDNKLITVDSARKLVDANKIVIKDKSILDDYQDGYSLYNKIKDRYNNDVKGDY